jgi:hypothetical protein
VKLVRVEWIDSTVYSDWDRFAELREREAIPITSVGYLLGKDKTAVRLIGDQTAVEGNRLIVIPKGCIIKMEEVG